MSRIPLAFALALWAVSSPFADTIHVDASNCPGPGTGTIGDPFCSLADGIAAAVAGDVVEVAPGTYTTTAQVFINIGQDITLRGTGGHAVTEITTTHVEAALVVLSDSLIEGFTFRGGDSLFNGGIVATSVGDPTFRNCRFTDNRAALGAGAVAVTNFSDTLFEGCLFDGNTTVGGAGGAVQCYSNATGARFVNCTFADNTASTSGGAVYCDAPAVADFANCVVWDNAPDGLAESAAGLVTVARSVVQGGWAGAAVSDHDPRFVDAAGGDYRLDVGPGVDSGDNASVASGLTTDLDGNARLDDDTGVPDTGIGGAPVVDMGAYERVVETQVRTFYLAPDGSDASDGLSAGAAWGTWAHALSNLAPGDTLVVRDGTWTRFAQADPSDPAPVQTSAALPYINCDPTLPPDPSLGLPYAKGLPGLPITVRAENERQAFLRSDGARSSIEVVDTHHWTFEGLRGESADLPSESGGYARSIFMLTDSEGIELRRMLGAKDNRYFNNHIYEFIRCHHSKVVECEAYDFHRHGFSAIQSTHLVYERCYAHSRGYPDIPGGYVSHTPDFGDEGLTCYFSHDCVVQNVIVEDSEGIQATGDDNTFLGCVTIGGWFGFRFAANCQDEGAQQCVYEEHYPTGNYGENLLSIDPELAFMDFDGSGGSVVRNLTGLGTPVWGVIGRDRLDTPGFITSFHLESSLAVHTAVPPIPGTVGFIADSSVDGPWSGSHLNSYGQFKAFSPEVSNPFGAWSDTYQLDPKLGGCLVHVPPTSPMATVSDQPIGATIENRYVDGVLTAQPLWDPVTGEFPCGAVVPGVNGPDDGESCWNVHERLNVKGHVAAQELVRLGSPPNPLALLPGQTSAPVAGQTWDPVLDHASFLPDAVLDFLSLSVSPTNLYLGPSLGTLLIDAIGFQPYVFASGPGVPFSLPIPNTCNLVGKEFFTQGYSTNGASGQLTNALDITVGSP